MAKYTITPWRHHSDLLTVRSQLYSNEPTLRQTAVSRIQAWKLRGNLPHAVESTALLVDAVLHHSATSNSPFSIRAVYTAAFTRFVTGFCDIGRNRERALEPSSMLEIARQIGMPEHFVALRHEATHEELPSLGRLVVACEGGLGWLRDVYWSRLDDTTPVAVANNGGIVEVAQVRTEARRLLRDFRSARRAALKMHGRQSQEAQAVVAEAAANLQSLCTSGAEAMKAAVAVLVDDELLYPSERELGAPLGGAFMIWDDLLLAVINGSNSTLQFLTSALFAAMSGLPSGNDTSDATKDALFLWVMHIATSEAWEAADAANAFDIHSYLMRECCLQPGHWSFRLGEALLNSSHDEAFVETWTDLLEASAIEIEGVNAIEVSAGASMAMEVDTAPVEVAGEDFIAAPWRRALREPGAAIGVVA